MPRAYKKKPKSAYQKETKPRVKKESTPRVGTTMKRLCSDQFGKQYAKEQYELYSDTTLFKTFAWEEHTLRMVSMCGIAYWLETSDDCPDNRGAAMHQAESTWLYLWKNKDKGVDEE